MKDGQSALSSSAKPKTASKSGGGGLGDALTRRKKQKAAPSVPTRSSKRLKALSDYENRSGVADAVHLDGESANEAADDEQVDEDDEKIDYTRMPTEPEDLDDDEFQVYVSLRAWRLQRKNELEVEPYKICQNRTLCELIRKRRNDSQFASSDSVHDDSSNDEAVESDLLSVWGIGPSKAAKGGFGWEMLGVLGSEESADFLARSRKNNDDEITTE